MIDAWQRHGLKLSLMYQLVEFSRRPKYEHSSIHLWRQNSHFSSWYDMIWLFFTLSQKLI